MAPLYLQEYCQPLSLSSAATVDPRTPADWLFPLPRTETKYGDRSFAVEGTRAWNSLRAPDITLETFRNKLRSTQNGCGGKSNIQFVSKMRQIWGGVLASSNMV